MSSSSSDPKVQHVWRLLANASVQHELAHKHRHENASVARGYVHNAVKHTVRAARAIRDTLETEEQFDLVMELESKFRPVLFRSIKDVIAQKRKLIGGETGNSDSDSETPEAQGETKRPEAQGETKEPEAPEQPAAPTAQKQSVPDNAENLLSGLFNELKEAQRNHDDVRQTLSETKAEKVMLSKNIADIQRSTTHLSDMKSVVESVSFEDVYTSEAQYSALIEKMKDLYNKKNESLKLAVKIRTAIFGPYVDRNNGDLTKTKFDKRVNSAMNEFVRGGLDFDHIDVNVAAAWNAASETTKSTFKNLCESGSTSDSVNSFESYTREYASMKDAKEQTIRARASEREEWRKRVSAHINALAYQNQSGWRDPPSPVTGMQQQPVAIPENVRTLSQTLESVGVSTDVGQEVKTLLEDLSRSIRIVVRILNRDIVDHNRNPDHKVDLRPSIQPCAREGYIRWVSGEEQTSTVEEPPQLQYDGDVTIDEQNSTGERFYGPFAKVLGPKEGGSGSCYEGVCNPTNSEFYTESIGPAVSRVLEGGVVLTSAYGYSGSGKTYGFFGSGEDPGALQLFLDAHKDRIQKVSMRVRELYGESETTDGLPGATLDSLTRMTGKIYEYDGSNGWQPRPPVDQPLAANLPGHLWYKECDAWYDMWPTLDDIRAHGAAYVDREAGPLRTGEWCYYRDDDDDDDEGVRGFKLGTFGDKVVMAWETTETDALPPYHHQKGAMELFGKASEEPALGAGGKKQAFARAFNRKYSPLAITDDQAEQIWNKWNEGSAPRKGYDVLKLIWKQQNEYTIAYFLRSKSHKIRCRQYRRN